ncbi:hypothetical protein HPB48_023990 [Haemaphysalis longicornis]|uniref:THAP-type domain-containing protein n=1 Tax=Haemaphysalis longicornis TaxID=44386 RepID=A0A9J6H7A0_HAELO|nr:hypothetical protein HPB48_023990 [Haemaphysalis longicornis]
MQSRTHTGLILAASASASGNVDTSSNFRALLLVVGWSLLNGTTQEFAAVPSKCLGAAVHRTVGQTIPTDRERACTGFRRTPQQNAAWTKAVRRENFVPTKYTVVCEHHFHESDFVDSASYNRQHDWESN